MLISEAYRHNVNNSPKKVEVCSKLIVTIKYLSKCLPRISLLPTHKLFISPHLDCGDILYDNSGNENLKSIEVQYQACLAIAGVIQRISR